MRPNAIKKQANSPVRKLGFEKDHRCSFCFDSLDGECPRPPVRNFESFVKDSSNEEGYFVAANLACAKNWRAPVLLVAEPGLGKSHLLEAIANQVLTDSPRARVMLIRGKNFVKEFERALRKNGLQDFRAWFRREVDVLIVDDFSFLNGKSRVCDEMYRTLSIHESRLTRIAIASPIEPSLLELSPDLACWVMESWMVTMTSPAPKARKEFVEESLGEEGRVDSALVEMVLKNTGPNFGEMKCLLDRIRAHAKVEFDSILSRAVKGVLGIGAV